MSEPVRETEDKELLNIEVTSVSVENVESSDKCTKCDTEEEIRLYKDAYARLLPEGHTSILKDDLIPFFELVLGPWYNSDISEGLIEAMEPDEEGKIPIENFIKAFSLKNLKHWRPESIAAMHEVLSANPEIVRNLADWKAILTKLGVDVSDADLANVIEQAQKGAAAWIEEEWSKSKENITDQEEVSRRSSEIMDMIMSKMVNVTDDGIVSTSTSDVKKD